MESVDLREADVTRLSEPYTSQSELLRDMMAWLDLYLYYYYSRHQWLGPSADLRNMLGLVVTREEFEHNLTKASQRGLFQELNEEEKEQIRLAEEAIRIRFEKTTDTFPILQLFSRFGLNAFERSCVILAYAPEIDRRYTKLLAYLQDDMTKKVPSCALACELFLPEGQDLEACLAGFSRFGVSLELFREDELERGNLVLKEMVCAWLASGSLGDYGGLSYYDGAVRRPDHGLLIRMDFAKKLDAVFTGQVRYDILICGAPGIGKRFQVMHLMSRQKAACVFADLAGTDWREVAVEAALAANLTDASLCLFHLDRIDETGQPVRPPASMMEELDRIRIRRGLRFFLAENPVPSGMRALTVEMELKETTEGERLDLFKGALRSSRCEGFTAEELAAKFRFTPKQIRTACEQAEGLSKLEGNGVITSRLIHESCYRQVVHKLGDLASRISPSYTWDDVVLPDSAKKTMRHACSHIRFRHQVYTRWGFDRKVGYGRGLSILFAGVPGTGKTMCAQVIANELDMELYKINLSQIVSKYIGETEKNMRAVFNEAKNAGCVLFFDECDALFGKRSEVKDSHDRNANVEVAYLLQQIEEYDGVCILATNLIGNIDAAFMRRITYIVHFPFPDAAAREEIYRRMLPKHCPISDDIDWKFMAEKFELSGGHIKNIVLSAAFMAAEEQKPVCMRHMIRSAVGELKKNEIVVVREQFREYADLLDDWT